MLAAAVVGQEVVLAMEVQVMRVGVMEDCSAVVVVQLPMLDQLVRVMVFLEQSELFGLEVAELLAHSLTQTQVICDGTFY
jgi:hypothetical protein